MEKKEFEDKGKEIRRTILSIVHRANISHIGSAFSVVDLMVYLFNDYLNFDVSKKDKNRDRFILSKGHSANAYYAMLHEKGLLSKKEIDESYEDGSYLGVHPNPPVPGVEIGTGSLGHGLSIGAGIALAGKINNRKYKTVVLLSDGECNEGQIWEAAAFASANKLSRLLAIVDYNKLQAFGKTDEVLYMKKMPDIWKSFGWNVIEIDGHDFNQIKDAFKQADLLMSKKGLPVAIVAHTKKGKGVSFMEGKLEWHYFSPNAEQFKKANEELK